MARIFSKPKSLDSYPLATHLAQLSHNNENGGRRVYTRLHELNLQKMKFFGHPRHPESFTHSELSAFYRKFRESLASPGLSEKEYSHLADAAIEDILSSWSDADKPIRSVLRKAFEIAKKQHPISQRRKDGTPQIFHPLEVAYLNNSSFADADTIIAALHHDTLEDVHGPEGGHKLIRLLSDVNSMTAEQKAVATLLAESSVWHVMSITNVPSKFAEARSREMDSKITRPRDWLNPEILHHLTHVFRSYEAYLRKQYNFLPDTTGIKSIDTNTNTYSLRNLDPTKNFKLMFNTMWKALMHVDTDKKLSYVIPYYTLENIFAGLEKFREAFGADEVRRAFMPFADMPQRDVPYIEFPGAIEWYAEYHRNHNSRQQDFSEYTSLSETSPRPLMRSSAIARLPLARSRVVSAHLSTPKHYYEVAPMQFEFSMPRFIGKGNPEDFSNFIELSPSCLVSGLEHMLSFSGLPLVVIQAKSVLRGPIGYDFINLRVEFDDPSKPLSHYLGSSDDLSAQMNTYLRIVDLLEPMMADVFNSQVAAAGKLADGARPNTIS